ncbi:murein biosynthesis integral membrane protein MurJ [Nocardioides dongkuii]|uniref:murein biosynthesis integral membrane protein MurJ n=1 Tax=Nocardioides dongkuii TaxID=2760089 RepID=UPI0018788348|nr:murein biosynthesis integral membrane protein MurJ [Nocardioides dongkuii]
MTEPAPPAPADRTAEDQEQRSILGSSAVMAAGTVVSRLSGFVRSGLLLAALGNGLHADVFNIANTIPNMLYILLAGGVFNAVLVPQLVRAMRSDEDGGAAYTSRIVTLAALFLGGVTVVLVLAAPWVVALATDGSWSPEAQRSAVDFARFCLPQVFFYGMFVLVGQVLNAHGRFGPMMWAPIANNVVSVAVLVIYLVVYGTTGGSTDGGFTTNQELLLGLGSTLGIAVQLLVLVPYLRAAGVRLDPRFDFRGTGLGHTLRLGTWTVLFVLANQVAYFVVVRLASSGTADGGADGTGYSVYSTAFLIIMVPHSVITVSLATAVLPTLSAHGADGDLRGLAARLGATLRTALAVTVPFAALLPLVATDLARLISYGRSADTYENFVPSLALFGPGLVFFTVHYLVLRGFYAVERTRTVFYIQCAVAVTNIVVAALLVNATGDADTAPALVVGYSAAYLVGSVISYTVLARVLGGLESRVLVRFLVRLGVTVAVSTAVAGGAYAVGQALLGAPTYLEALLRAGVVTALDVAVFLLLARALRLREVTSVLATITRRLPAARRG